MTPDELLEKLKEYGVSISRRTLLRYEEIGLISPAERGGLGRGKGRVTIYPTKVLHETLAASLLLSAKLTREQIAEARKDAINLVDYFFTVKIHGFLEDMTDEQIVDTMMAYQVINPITYLWLMIKTKLEYGLNLDGEYHIEYTGACDSNEPPKVRVISLEEGLKMPYYFMEKSGVIAFNDEDTAISFRFMLPQFMPTATKGK